MTRKCSYCSHNGHNSRTCPNRGVKLFGVRLTDGSIRKSASMGNLMHYSGSNSNNPSSPGDLPEPGAVADGYASEDFAQGSCSSSRERKKDEWWMNFGIDDLELQNLAIRILSRTCSSSGCERNWSVFERIHTKRRNRLEHKSLNDLVYTHYNLRLKERQSSRKSLTDPISLENIDLTDDWVVEAEDDDAPLLDVDEIDDWMDVADAILDEGEGGHAAGVPWTEDEHRMFLLGLQKLGKGDWRGIARNFVVSRTPTQVASHAQKYFIRQTNLTRRKRRSSLFDIIAETSVDTTPVSQELFPIAHEQAEAETGNPLPSPVLDPECESMDSTNANDAEAVVMAPEPLPCSYPMMFPTYFSPIFPFSFPFWPGFPTEEKEKGAHEVVKPMAIHSKDPINVDELVGMSKLSLGEAPGRMEPSALSLKLVEGSGRQSAFHANPSMSSSGINSSNSAIHAV